VYEVVYFNFRSLSAVRSGTLGYVVHAEPKRFSHAFWISIGPLFINSTLAIAFGHVAFHLVNGFFTRLVLCWVAISIGMYAFPSDQDARNVFEWSKREIGRKRVTLHHLSYPFYWVICFINGLRRSWVDFTYAAMLIGIGSRF
jgi:hypothetical protein